MRTAEHFRVKDNRQVFTAETYPGWLRKPAWGFLNTRGSDAAGQASGNVVLSDASGLPEPTKGPETLVLRGLEFGMTREKQQDREEREAPWPHKTVHIHHKTRLLIPGTAKVNATEHCPQTSVQVPKLARQEPEEPVSVSPVSHQGRSQLLPEPAC